MLFIKNDVLNKLLNVFWFYCIIETIPMFIVVWITFMNPTPIDTFTTIALYLMFLTDILLLILSFKKTTAKPETKVHQSQESDIFYYWHPSKTEIEENLLLISFNQRLILKFKNTPYKSIEGLTTLAFVRFFHAAGADP